MEELVEDAPPVIARYFPEAPALYARRGWTLPTHIDRVYDPSKAERLLGFRCRTDFAAILRALKEDAQLPFVHDPSYVSPKENGSMESAAS
jgi:UDP-glucose 4-epimerase